MNKTVKGILIRAKYMLGCMLVLFGIGINGINVQAAKGDIAINQKNFKNPYFRIYIRDFDTNKDDILSASERNKVTKINCVNMPITDFTGIEYFPNLTSVNIEKCDIQQIDLSKNILLESVTIDSARNCKSVNLSNLKNLEYLKLTDCLMETLDLSGYPKLCSVWIWDCDNLERLDFSYDESLEYIRLLENYRLKSLDLTGCKKMYDIEIRNSKHIQNLNFTGSEKLYRIRLKQLDLLQTVQFSGDLIRCFEAVETPNLKSVDLSDASILRNYYNKGDRKIVGTTPLIVRYTMPEFLGNVILSDYASEYLMLDAQVKVKNNVRVNASSSNLSGGSITGGGVYSTGDKVTITVKDNGNEKFQYEGIKVNGKFVTKNKTYTFTASEDVNIEAVFTYWFPGLVIMEMSDACVFNSTFGVRMEDTDTQGTYSYQWKRDVENIKGATGRTYVTRKEDIGHIITCVVTSSRGGSRNAVFGTVQKRTTAATPVNLAVVPPSYKGAKNGKILGTTDKMEYCMKSDFKNSKVCSKNSMTGLAPGTYYIRLRENETTKAGPAIAVKIEEGLERLKGTVTVSGVPKIGETIKALEHTELYLSDMSYQWKRDGKAIPGENAYFYTLQVADLGCKISCTVTHPLYGSSLTGTLEGIVEKADATAIPDGITAKAPSKYGLSDGHIFGVTKAMEYSTTSKFTTKKACGENKLTLKAGTYYIRYAETKSTKAGKALKVVIPNGPTATDIFADVKKGDWFEEAVKYVYAKGIMNGVSGIDFKPQAAMTRAEFVTTLYNFAGRPGVSKKAGFKDVEKGSWYEQAVNWAYSLKITTGVSKDKFGTNDKITRQQAATMFYQYAKVMKLKTDHKDTALDEFSDKKKVASWAKEAFEWAVYNGVIGGKLQGKKTILAPEAAITRAECAQMIKNMADHVKTKK